MGEPNNPCFKPSSPYIKWTTTTTTSTTAQPPSDDYFLLPFSGAICPSIVFDSGSNRWEYPEIPLIEKNIFTCISEQYDPNPCVIEIDKYIRVADININIDRCKRYKLILNEISITNSTSTTTTTLPPESSYFKTIGSKLYIDSSVLDFGMPSKTYNVRISLIDIDNNNTIFYQDHSVNVNPCEC